MSQTRKSKEIDKSLADSGQPNVNCQLPTADCQLLTADCRLNSALTRPLVADNLSSMRKYWK